MVAVQKLAERRSASPRVIATDVGGTTFKVGLIVDGRWSMAPETVINQYTLLSPMIDVVSIGAGGGSIAWADNGRLRIGPESAGAAPGPACYGWGGTKPTVTDADALLGYLNPARFLDGRIQLRLDLATEAMREHVADPLFDGDVIAAAAGVRRVVDSQMGDLIRKATLERGFDPRSLPARRLRRGRAGARRLLRQAPPEWARSWCHCRRPRSPPTGSSSPTRCAPCNARSARNSAGTTPTWPQLRRQSAPRRSPR